MECTHILLGGGLLPFVSSDLLPPVLSRPPTRDHRQPPTSHPVQTQLRPTVLVELMLKVESVLRNTDGGG